MAFKRLIKTWYKQHFESLQFYEAYERRIAIKWLDIKKGDKILDLGFGIGNILRKITKRGGIGFGVDNCKKNMELAKKFNPFSRYFLASADKLPFGNNFFDKITSTSSLEHMKNLQKVFIEAGRVLKPNGKFVFSIDCFENKGITENFRKRYFKERGIENRITYKKIRFMLEKAGFVIIKKRYLFCSGLGSRLQLTGIKLSENKLLRTFISPLISPVAYPLIILMDFLNKKEKGNVLVVEATKKSNKKTSR